MKILKNKDFLKIICSSLLFGLSFLFKIKIYKILLLGISYGIISLEIYLKALKNLKKGEIFDENFLMIIATIGAIIIRSYEEAVLVMLLYSIGEFLSDLAVDKSKDSIMKLMDLRVETITLEGKGKVKLEEAKIGDVFLVKPGERVPLDGIVLEGESYLDTSSLTGESVPRKISPDEEIVSGCINKNSLLKIKATSNAKNSTVQRIMNIIEEQEEKKTNTETFIHKFAKIYTPTVCSIAFLFVMIPAILGQDIHTWIYRALVFLVTSCPCALVISVPLGYFCGIGKASKEGIIIKGSKELEKLVDINSILFDKTGTLTEGTFEITSINTKMEEEEFLRIITSAEENSIHPIANIIKEKYKKKTQKVENYQEISGQGIKCKIDNKTVYVGNAKLLKENDIIFDEAKESGTIVYLGIEKEYKGYLVISDIMKEESKELKKVLQQEIAIVSGDNEKVTKDTANILGIKTYYSSLLPIDKVEIIKKYQQKGKTMFVGDGINDAPVLKIADIGVSMGGIGSDAAIEASDIILMQDNPTKIAEAIEIAKVTKRKVKESILLALFVKFTVLLLSLFDKSTIMMATFSDVGVTLLAVLNVLTIFWKKKS